MDWITFYQFISLTFAASVFVFILKILPQSDNDFLHALLKDKTSLILFMLALFATMGMMGALQMAWEEVEKRPTVPKYLDGNKQWRPMAEKFTAAIGSETASQTASVSVPLK